MLEHPDCASEIDSELTCWLEAQGGFTFIQYSATIWMRSRAHPDRHAIVAVLPAASHLAAVGRLCNANESSPLT